MHKQNVAVDKQAILDKIKKIMSQTQIVCSEE